MSGFKNIAVAIKRASDEIEKGLNERAAIAGKDLVKDITNRFIERGEDSKGAKLPSYSDNEIPAFFYVGKGRNKSADSAAAAIADEGGTLSYKGWRAINNLSVTVTNLQFTGLMWNQTDVLGTQGSNGRVVIKIGGKDEDTRKKIAYNSERYGDILDPSQQEIEDMTTDFNTYVENTLRKFL